MKRVTVRRVLLEETRLEEAGLQGKKAVGVEFEKSGSIQQCFAKMKSFLVQAQSARYSYFNFPVLVLKTYWKKRASS